MDGPNDQLKRDDPVAWARAETVAFSKRKAKFYGTLALIAFVMLVLLSKDMPGHFLWPHLGAITGIALVCLTAVAGFYALALVGGYMCRSKPHE